MGSSRAQEGIPVYSDYLSDNLYLLHPSMAGAALANQIRLTARQQWFDVDDAPNLQTLSINGRVGDKVGLGGIAFADQNGYFSQAGVYGTFAYHLLLSRNPIDLNQVSFGMSVGILQNSIDETAFAPGDPAISGGSLSDTFFNVDIGASYYFLDFYAHATVKNILPRERALFNDIQEFESTNQRRYIASVGYVFGQYGSTWSYEPSIMFQATDETKEATIDGNIKVYKDFDDEVQLWGGLSYRRSFDGAEFTADGEEIRSQKLQYITPFLGVNYKDFIFAYTYSYQNNSVVFSNGGFHQITLGYDFNKRREKYQCNCPAIN